MSKDFGIAGIRAGYAIMAKERVADLLHNGFLWNISGLAAYFFELYSNKEFNSKYELIRKKYIIYCQHFLDELAKLSPKLKVYPSMSNFALVELLNGETATKFTSDLLEKGNIYVRNCDDKIGLNGEFVRIASRTFEENERIVKEISKLL